MRNDETLLATVGIIVLFFLFSGLFGYGSMGYGMMNSGCSTLWGTGFVFMVLACIALILVIMWLFKQLHMKPSKHKKR